MVRGLEEAKKQAWLDTPRDQIATVQQAALMRLQLAVTGETHRILAEGAEQAGAALLAVCGKNGVVDTPRGLRALERVQAVWRGALEGKWVQMVQSARQEAASLPFGALALHQRQLRKLAGSLTEAPVSAEGVFEPQLKLMMTAANQRVYDDGLTLSNRIWRLEMEAREGINRVMLQAIADEASAWDTAQKLQSFLGANADCPRWTRTRLYQVSKQDIAAGDRTGLKSGAECAGQGVAYNALRLARNEIQAVHHLAADHVAAQMPWIEKEQVVLSGAHPATGCDCETIVAGGEGGQGIYPKGTIQLPIHPHCLCWKRQVLMDEDEFTGRLRGWMRGETSWPGMDRYAEYLGMGREVTEADLSDDPVALALGVWLLGDEASLLGRL